MAGKIEHVVLSIRHALNSFTIRTLHNEVLPSPDIVFGPGITHEKLVCFASTRSMSLAESWVFRALVPLHDEPVEATFVEIERQVMRARDMAQQPDLS